MLGGCYNDIQECWDVDTMTYRNVGTLDNDIQECWDVGMTLGRCYNDIQECWEVGNVGTLVQ